MGRAGTVWPRRSRRKWGAASTRLEKQAEAQGPRRAHGSSGFCLKGNGEPSMHHDEAGVGVE